MKKILKFLKIIQTFDNRNKIIKKGRGYAFAHRMNPYNPLSYITIIGTLLIGILMFGFVGMWKEVDLHHPFKWN